MNIFYLDRNPKFAAKDHCDKHVSKMLLETAQILSTALFLNDISVPNIYKPTHIHHPSVKWAAKNLRQFEWLKLLGVRLGKEFVRRYDKNHKSQQVLNEISWHMCQIPNWGDDTFTDPPQVMPDKYKQDNTVQAYRDYYMGEKRHIATWYRGLYQPYWYREV